VSIEIEPEPALWVPGESFLLRPALADPDHIYSLH
jgi:hypothetical protein